jgi:hypothetical protein
LDNVEAIARAFGIDPCDLFTLADAPVSEVDDSAMSSRLAGLPEAERDKIAAFIDFTLAQYVKHHNVLSFADVADAKAMQQRVEKSAGKPVTRRTMTADQKHETTQKNRHRRTRNRP